MTIICPAPWDTQKAPPFFHKPPGFGQKAPPFGNECKKKLMIVACISEIFVSLQHHEKRNNVNRGVADGNDHHGAEDGSQRHRRRCFYRRAGDGCQRDGRRSVGSDQCRRFLHAEERAGDGGCGGDARGLPHASGGRDGRAADRPPAADGHSAERGLGDGRQPARTGAGGHSEDTAELQPPS